MPGCLRRVQQTCVAGEPSTRGIVPEYAYDIDGNVTTITDDAVPGTPSFSLSYDALWPCPVSDDTVLS